MKLFLTLVVSKTGNGATSIKRRNGVTRNRVMRFFFFFFLFVVADCLFSLLVFSDEKKNR